MSDICKNWTQWLKETRFATLTPEMREQTLKWLETVRDITLGFAELKEGETVLDIGTGTGLMAFKALEILNGTGEVIFSDKFQDCLDDCENILKQSKITTGYRMLLSDCANMDLASESVDKALMRSVLVHIVDKQSAIDEIYRVLKKGGKYCAFEPIIRTNTRYWELVDSANITDFEDFKKAENDFMTNSQDSLTNFDEKTIAKNLEIAGFSSGEVNLQAVESAYVVTAQMPEAWFNTPPSPDQPTTKQRFLKYFDEPKVDNYIAELTRDLTGKQIKLKTNAIFINATK